MIPINAPCRSRTSVAVDIASSIWLNNFSRRLVVVSAKSSAIIDMRRSYRRNLADVKIADCYQRSKSQKLAINLLSNQSTVARMLEKPCGVKFRAFGMLCFRDSNRGFLL